MPKSRESDEDFNTKRKRDGVAYARESNGSWQAICPRPGCSTVGLAGNLAAALRDAVLHDFRTHR